jgi:murein hydrolase activator
MLSFLKTIVKIILVSSGMLWCLPAGLPADTLDSLTQEKQTIKTRMHGEQSKVQEFSQKETRLIQDLDAIDYRLNQARIRTNTLSSRISELEKTMAALQADRQDLSRRIDERRPYAQDRMAALYRMHAAGRLNMMTPPATVFDFLVNRRAMEQVVGADYEIINNLNQDLSQIQAIEAQMTEQKAAMDKLEHDLAQEIQIMTRTSEKKQTILHAIQHQKKMAHAALASLKESADALDRQIAGFEKQRKSDRDMIVFSRQKGRLMPPVAGEIISRFGIRQSGDYKSFTFQSGIDIRGEQGEPVRSVFRGNVIFAEWLKGYGNMVIINHGENYYTLYAHLQEMFKKKGDGVDAGEVIATLGDTGSLKGVCLHFELRHHGKPVDPLKWLKKGA